MGPAKCVKNYNLENFRLYSTHACMHVNVLSSISQQKNRVQYGKTGFPSIFINGKIDGHKRALRSTVP